MALTDARTQVSKGAKRKSVFASTIVLGEETIRPPAIERLREAFARHGAGAPMEVVVNELALIDYFPKRLAPMATSYGAANALISELLESNTDWKLVKTVNLPANGEAIVCLFAGTIDGKPAEAAAYAEYRTSMTTLSIRGSKAFKAALDEAIDKCAAQALASARGVP